MVPMKKTLITEKHLPSTDWQKKNQGIKKHLGKRNNFDRLVYATSLRHGIIISWVVNRKTK